MTRFQYVAIYWLPIFFYCLLIFIQSSLPLPQKIPKLPYMDKVFHFFGYAILGLLFLRAFRTLWFKDRVILLLLSSIIASIVYGMSDELHQLYVPYRSASLMDIGADTLGSIFGVFFSAKWFYNYTFPR
ncbi:MAG: VanZ family protein [Desulfobacterales bacterium]|nr:VanZ family protein [Desulfobacterales bacterium]